MNVLEGSRRMQKSGRRITIYSGIAFIVLLILFEAWVYFRDSLPGDAVAQGTVRVIFAVIPVDIIALLIGGVLWLAGWIMEGFNKNHPSA